MQNPASHKCVRHDQSLPVPVEQGLYRRLVHNCPLFLCHMYLLDVYRTLPVTFAMDFFFLCKASRPNFAKHFMQHAP